MSTGPDELRALVREVLREALPPSFGQAQARDVVPGERVGTGAVETRAVETAAVETVAVATDADLAALVHRVAELSEDPAVRADLLAGRRRFALAARFSAASPVGLPAARTAAPAATRQQSPALRVESGAVTERHVKEAARSGARLIAGRAAVLTPLARDRARALGVEVERER